MDWISLYCPNRCCRYYGIPFSEGLMVKNGTGHGYKQALTSFIERDNLTQRQNNRRLARRTNGFCKELTWLEKQLWLSLTYYHLVLPHHSLRQRLLTPQPTRGTGSPRLWQLITPAMVAGITDHVWATTGLLSYRVPVQFLDQLSEFEYVFPALE